MSAGIAFDDADDPTADALLHNADHAMYRAERSLVPVLVSALARKVGSPFVRDAVGNRADTALLRAIVEVGAALGMSVTAKGIETAE